MFCNIDQATLQAAALKAYGPGVQVGLPMYIDTLSESICVAITPYHKRSFHGRFYYLKGSFDQKDENRV